MPPLLHLQELGEKQSPSSRRLQRVLMNLSRPMAMTVSLRVCLHRACRPRSGRAHRGQPRVSTPEERIACLKDALRRQAATPQTARHPLRFRRSGKPQRSKLANVGVSPGASAAPHVRSIHSPAETAALPAELPPYSEDGHTKTGAREAHGPSRCASPSSRALLPPAISAIRMQTLKQRLSRSSFQRVRHKKERRARSPPFQSTSQSCD